MTALTLSGLYVYPIKSAAGIAVSEASMTARGLQYDRRWMVVDAQGKFMTQRRFPRMALIGVEMGEQLKITAPGMSDLSVPLTAVSGERVNVEVWGDGCEAIALCPKSKQWFTQFIGVDCQLVYMPDSSHRPTDHGRFGDDSLVSFADAYPYLLISEASLAGLNHKLAENQKLPVPVSRFRPNLVIKGDIEPHAEDSWQQIQVGSAVFDLPKLCARCSIPNVDTQTGDYPKDRHGHRTSEPSQTLATYRAWDRGIWFGQNCVQYGTSSSTLRIGDPVNVLQDAPKSAVT
ncbi:MAG: MOSC N-terminal beta barrel domain-containing protein [Phormidesmis sp.]